MSGGSGCRSSRTTGGDDLALAAHPLEMAFWFLQYHATLPPITTTSKLARWLHDPTGWLLAHILLWGLVGDRAPSTLSTQIGPHTTLAFTWFMSLLAGSVSGWTDLEKQFHKYFLSGLGPEGR